MNNTELPECWAEFAVKVRDTQASLRSFIRMLGVKPDSVDDLAQETYIIAFKGFDNFDKEKDFLVWLRGIAKNLVFNENRKNARHRRIMDEMFSSGLVAQFDTTDERVRDIKEAVDAMHGCLETLSPRNKDLLMRRYEDDSNATVLAKEMAMSGTAVRQTLFKIRVFLQECIEGKVGEVAP